MAIFLDDAQTLFFKRQLEEIDSKIYEVRRAKLEALELVSTKQLHPGAETHTYRQYDGRGVAKAVANYEGRAARVDLDATETTVPVKSYGNSFGYSVQEIRAAQMANIPLDQMKGMIAKRAIDEKLNLIALRGDAEFGVVGLLNQTGPTIVTLPNDGSGSSILWSTKTGAQMARDMMAVIDAIPTATNEVESAKRLIMPYSSLRLASATPYSATFPNKTALQWVQEQRPGVEIRGALHTDTAGAGGTKRMLAYDPAAENLEWVVPIPFERFPEERVGTQYVVECRARSGGVCVRYPLTMAYGDGF